MLILGSALLGLLIMLPVLIHWFSWLLVSPPSKDGPKVPKGNLGIPYLGESLHFFYQSPDNFFKDRFKRFGNIFLTHILGSPTIVCTTPEQAKFVLATKHKSFKAVYPPSIARVLNHPSWEGAFHQRIRKIVQAPMVPEMLRVNLHKFEKLARWTLESWDQQPYIITHDETRKFAFHVALCLTTSMAPNEVSMKLLDDYGDVSNGAISLPIDLPGTGFRLALKRSKEILATLTSIVKGRRLDDTKYDDILNALMESIDENGEKLTNDQIRDIMITFLFAGHETTAVFLVWIVKYLTEHPDILAKVKEEQDAVKKAKASEDEGLTWSELRGMSYTMKVIQETLRLANVAPFSPREVMEDVEYKGTLFPKGYKVQVYYRHFHLNPEYWPEPHKFDPSRFEQSPKPAVYTPFGNGIRLCPGNEVVKVEALLFIHLLVTKYRWEIVSKDTGVQYWPTPRPRGGLHLKVYKRED